MSEYQKVDIASVQAGKNVYKRVSIAKDQTHYAVEQLRGVGRWIARNADELVGDMAHNYVAEDGLRFTIQMAYDALPTVTAHKTFIVLIKRGEGE